jgi:hypothetical protein
VQREQAIMQRERIPLFEPQWFSHCVGHCASTCSVLR